MIDSLVQKFLTKDYMFKMGNKNIAAKYGAGEHEVREARDIAKKSLKKEKKAVLNDYIVFLEDEVIKRIDEEKGTLSSEVTSQFDPKNHEELAKLHKIDLSIYRISSYWSKLKSNGKFTSSVFCTLIKADSKEKFQQEFKDFLLKPTISTAAPTLFNQGQSLRKGCLLLPQQDAHFNKLDIDGNNDIDERFQRVRDSAREIVSRATGNYNLDQIVYIVGSDEFNSEWTGLTTKGTPQQNILTYQEAFQRICQHEVDMINDLLQSAKDVDIVFIPGNHDEFVGWHLINWLESYFRLEPRLHFQSMVDNTKYFQYGTTAVMLNHGDDMKPKDLAAKFPIGFKDYWSDCDHYYAFTGDKHTENVVELGGIKIHRISQLSTSKGKWDDKKGFENRAEMTAFLFKDTGGLSDIIKEFV